MRKMSKDNVDIAHDGNLDSIHYEVSDKIEDSNDWK